MSRSFSSVSASVDQPFFVFFAVVQAHGIKEQGAQLFGAVGVEIGGTCLHLDAGQHLVQLLPQLHAESLNAITVYKDAGAGHIGQHLCQREFNVVVELVLAVFGDLCLHFGEQVCQETGIGGTPHRRTLTLHGSWWQGW